MQIDILIETQPLKIRDTISTLSSLVIDTDVGCRLAVLMHGGPRKDFTELDEFLVQGSIIDEEDVKHTFQWTVVHQPKALHFNSARWRLVQLKKNDLAALVEPGLAMNDPKWFGKVQQTFLKDPRNMLTIMLPFVNASLPPNRALQNAEASGPLIVGSQDLSRIIEECVGGEMNFATELRFAAKRFGGNRWLIASIRHIVVECLEPRKSEQGTIPFE